ncbi:Crp/Fnr family transcriptional regulator [Maribacter sp. 2-571]|uniref:Crp/Fnr family transcriptional regulator n=1 Tax=Maribacter sp. 2-571 TaxID=3417569 RepID=UPI003D33887C
MKEILEAFLIENGLSQKATERLCFDWSTPRKIKKNDYLLKVDQQKTFLYFICSGCIAVIVEGEKKDVVLGFGYQGSLVTEFVSFAMGTPAKNALIAVTDCTVLQLRKDKLQMLLDKDLEVGKWYRNLLENTLAGHLKRQIELTTLTPKERYRVFLGRSGHLVNAIPLKMISSYLNMAQETLSRVRKDIS